MSDELVTSYSQIAEDILILRALRDIDNGFYIDIGAWDPELDSVTKIFYDAGWTGINVEPNPHFFKRLLDQRKHDLNFDLAISDCAGELELNVIEDTGLTTLDAQIASGHNENYGLSIEKVTVQSLPLRRLWDENVPAGQDVHFLKIDVEGAEEQVVRGADWTRHRPWILVIESTLPRSVVQSYQDWEPMLLKADYIYAYFDGLNRYYVAKEKKELLAAFEIPLNVVTDNYIPFVAHLAERRFKDTGVELEKAEVELEKAEAELEKAGVELEKVEAARKAVYADLLELRGKHSITTQHMSWLETCMKNRPRPLWERLLFRSTGKPKKALRKLLFHTSGKPRGVFRKYILRPDRLPRSAFYTWMSGQAYQELRAAVRLPGVTLKSARSMELSGRGKEMMRRLQSGKSPGDSTT